MIRTFFKISLCLLSFYSAAHALEISNQKLSAEQYYSLASIYDQQHDAEKAFKHYQKAADLGHYIAIHDLAWCHLEGFGVSQDKPKGMELLRQSASMGFPKAMTALSILNNREGKESESFYWQSLAAYQTPGQDKEIKDIIIRARQVLYGILSDSLEQAVFIKTATTSVITKEGLSVTNIILDHESGQAIPMEKPTN